MTLKINRVPDSLKDYVCTKFGENPYIILIIFIIKKTLPSVFGKSFTKFLNTMETRSLYQQVRFKMEFSFVFIFLNNKDYVCTKFGENPLKDVNSSVHKDVMQ
jgi:hypothetical protein